MSKLKPGFGRLATISEAFDVLFQYLPALGTEHLAIDDSLHRFLAADLVAPIDVPHFLKASMDGYAVAAQDTFGASDSVPRVLAVSGAASPGQGPGAQVGPGRCVEIGTGALMPPGADSVVMVEYTEPAEDNQIRIRKGVAPGENVIGVGSDIAAGSMVLRKGTKLEPRHLGVPAAAGVSRLEVWRKPRVAVFSTGPEILAIDEEAYPGSVFNINSHTLGAALRLDGCEVIDLGVVPDDLDLLKAALAKGLEQGDLLLLSGGSSLGGGDLVVEAFEGLGQVFIHGVAVKPGKPLVLAVAGGKMMIGLPGYPMSALSDYYIFVQPYLQRAMGAEARAAFSEAILARKHPSTVGRYEFLPVKLLGDEAHPVTKGSSSISALADADGFIEIDENTEVLEQGSKVRVRLF